jgi:hypothetical protein
MKANNGDIVTLVTTLGEVIGKVSGNTPETLTLEKPRLFVPGEGGKSGFAPGICMTGETEPEELEFNMNNVLTVTKSHQQIADGWTQATTGIALS